MFKLIAAIFVSLLFSLTLNAQTNKTTTSKPATVRGPFFKANKEQITEVQKSLKIPETGKLDDATRIAVMKYQSENGLRTTGTLNRATLEKMGIALTDKQKEIPVSASSLAKPEKDPSERKRGPVFRATKDQINAAQKLMKQKGLYEGDETGKLDDDTREALKSYQETNGLKSTGTLNPATLKKMGIDLTEKQKENSSGSSQ